jgi:hypothetical protein
VNKNPAILKSLSQPSISSLCIYPERVNFVILKQLLSLLLNEGEG